MFGSGLDRAEVAEVENTAFGPEALMLLGGDRT